MMSRDGILPIGMPFLFFILALCLCCTAGQDAPLGYDDISRYRAQLQDLPPAEMIARCTDVIEQTAMNARNLSEFHVLRGNAYGQLGQADSALADYDQAIHLFPNHVSAYMAKAKIQVGQDQLEPALRTLEQAEGIRRDSSISGAKGLVLLQMKRVEDALETLTQAIADYPHDPRLYIVRSMAYQAAGQTENAERDLTAARRIENRWIGIYDQLPPRTEEPSPGAEPAWTTDRAEAAYQEAKALAGKSDCLGALEIIARILEKFPDHRRARLLRARCLVNTGKHSLAIDDLTILIDQTGYQELLFLLRAEACYAASRYDEALSDWRVVLRNNPGSEDARRQIERLEKEAGPARKP